MKRMYETGICIVHLHKKTVELKTIWALFRSFYLSFSILHKFIKKGKELWHEWKAAKEKSSICSLNIFQSFVTSCTVAQSTHIQTYTYTYTCAVRRQVWRYYAKHWTPDSQFTWELAEIGASIDRIKLVDSFEDDRCRKRRDNNTPYQNASRITGEQATDIESIWYVVAIRRPSATPRTFLLVIERLSRR